MRRAAILYALFVGILFSRFFLFGEVYVPGDVLNFLFPWRGYHSALPGNLELFDVTVFFYPQDVFFNHSLKSGVFPLWNPYIFGGHPVVASGQSGFLYPLRILFHEIFSVGVAKTWLQVIHVLGMGLAMRWFLKLRGFGEFAAALGGLVWMGNSHMMSWLEFEHVPIAGFYLPVMLVCLEKGLAGHRKWWLALCLAGSLTLHCGHLQVVTYIGLTFGAYALLRLWQAPSKEAVGWYALVGALTLGMAAPTVLPFVHFLGQSQRMPLIASDNAASFSSLLSSLLCPDILGNPSLGFMLNRCRTNLIYPEFACFVGTIPLVFALSAKGRAARALQALSLALVVVASAPFSLTLPFLDRFVPGRILIILMFVLVYLAAMGAQQSVEGEQGLRRVSALLAVVWLGLWGAAVACSLHPQSVWQWVQAHPGSLKLPPLNTGEAAMAQAMRHTYLFNPELYAPFLGFALLVWARRRENLLLGFTALQLVWFAFLFNPAVKPDSLFPVTPEIAAIKDKSSRVTSLRCANYNTLTPYGLMRINGYESLVDALYGMALSQAEPDHPLSMRSLTLEKLNAPILDALSLKYALTPPAQDSPGPEWKLEFEGDGGRVWVNPQALPRAYLVSEVEPLRDPRDLARLVPTRFAFSSMPAPAPLSPGEGQIEWQETSPNEIHLLVTCTTEQFLVLTDTYREGWHCYDKDRELPIARANLASRGVYLSAGEHQLLFRFEPPYFWLGVKLAAAAGVVWLLLAVGILWKSKVGGGNEFPEPT